MITLATVLKSGGDFGPEDVHLFYMGLEDAVKDSEYRTRALCLSDVGKKQNLRHSFPGWWSKMELFGITGPVLTFDLDTVFTGSIAPLLSRVNGLGENEFLMVRDFMRPDSWNSSIMGWNGNKSWILDGFLRSEPVFGNSGRVRSAKIAGESFRGDQDYISHVLRESGVMVQAVQDVMPGVLSYKMDVRQRKGSIPPPGTRIVCFHGLPRPRDIRPRPDWIKARV